MGESERRELVIGKLVRRRQRRVFIRTFAAANLRLKERSGSRRAELNQTAIAIAAIIEGLSRAFSANVCRCTSSYGVALGCG